MVSVHWQSNPEGQPGQGTAHAVNRHAELLDGSPPHPRVGSNTLSGTEGRCLVPSPTPKPINAGLGTSLLHTFLAKATWTAGTAGWVDDTEGWGKKAQ